MRTLPFVAAGIGIAALGYAGSAYYVGTRLASEVALYEKQLLEIEGVSVTRLSYERRLLEGEVVYDLAWRAPQGHPLREVLEELTGLQSRGGLRLTGRIPVRHGPWVGKVALARAEMNIPLPDEVRAFLPNYPGQAPWLTVDAVVDLSGALVTDLRVVDYSGQIGGPDSTGGVDAVLHGFGGRVRVAAGASEGSLELAISELQVGEPTKRIRLGDIRLTSTGARAPKDSVKASFSIGSIVAEDKGVEPGRLSVGPVRSEIDLKREWPFIWSGVTSVAVEKVAFEAGRTKANLSAMSARSETTRSDSRVSSASTLELGPSEIGGIALPGFAIGMSLRNLEGSALNELLEVVDMLRADNLERVGELLLARLEAVGTRLAVAGPELTVDRLALTVVAPDDIRVSFRARLAPGTVVSTDRLADLPDGMEGRFQTAVDLGALEEAMVRIVGTAALLDGRPPLNQAEAAAIRERFARARTVLAEQPFVKIDGNVLRTEGTFARGKLTVHGKETDPLELVGQVVTTGERIYALLEARPPTSSAAAPRRLAQTAGVSPPTVRPPADRTPRFSADPAFGRIALSADFEPDPRRINVLAGGNDLVDGKLGADCVGHIDADKPDYVLDYRAGRYDLFIYAESAADTAIVLHTPDGSWLCNDDGENRGLDPTVRVRAPQSGRYAIWIASIEKDTADAVLMVSESDPNPRRPR
jgi:hypothetical protein